jgi:hypothetical protein
MQVVNSFSDIKITNKVFPKTIYYIRRLYISMYNKRIIRVYIMQFKGNLV